MSLLGGPSKLSSSMTIAYAFVVGVLGDILIGDAARGIAFFLWVLIIAGMAWMLMRRAELAMTRETTFWLVSAVAFSAAIAWRDALALQLFNFMATFFALAMVAASCRRVRSLLFASGVKEIVKAFSSVCMSMAFGGFSLVSDVVKARGERPQKSFTRILRAGSFAIILAIVFLALLRSADPVFASFATLPPIDFQAVIRHLVVSIIFTTAIGGAAHAAIQLKPKIDEKEKSAFGLQFDRLEIVFALGALNVLFGAFVLTQLGWLFGGEQFLHERTGLSIAEYARSGFFQMVIVVLLVIPVLLFTRWLMVPSRAIARLHTCLSIPIIFLLTLMIISSTMKMQLYVAHFGLSTDRLYTLIFLLWLGFVLIWLSMTVLRDRGVAFPSGAVLSAFATLILLNIMVPDRIVASLNIARAKKSTSPTVTVDIGYLANLSADAADISVHAVLALSPATPEQKHERCGAATTLLLRFGDEERKEFESPRNSWRFWNAGDATARRVVHLFADELRAVCTDHDQSLMPINDRELASN